MAEKRTTLASVDRSSGVVAGIGVRGLGRGFGQPRIRAKIEVSQVASPRRWAFLAFVEARFGPSRADIGRVRHPDHPLVGSSSSVGTTGGVVVRRALGRVGRAVRLSRRR